MKTLIALLSLLAAGVALWQWKSASEIVQVPVVAAARGVFQDQVTTNGRVEPSEWASARAEREGLVISAPVTRGQRVSRGFPLAILDSKDAQADLASAEARMAEARAAIAALEAGGSRREIVEIEESLKQRRQDKAQTEKELATAERLLARNAGTREEVRVLRDKIDGLNLQIAALEAKRPALVSPADLVREKARLREAETAAEQARRRIDLSTIRSPLDGVAYQVEVKLGAYLSPGALVASVGKIDTLKVVVYVDEPELGRVAPRMPVKITWDALEGRSWMGLVDKTPTQIVPLGTRQVGEVECRIDNPGGELLPGTNVNVAIETKQLSNVLLVPKEALRNVEGVEGVFLVENNILVFRAIQLGARNVVNAIVTGGLKAGDLVALGPGGSRKPGQKVAIEGKKPSSL